MKRQSILNSNIKTLYSLVWGQCTNALRARIEARDDYDQMCRDARGLDLLAVIKAVVYNFQDQRYLPHLIHEAKRRVYGLIQRKHVSTQAYYESFQNNLDVIEHCGGSLGIDPGISKKVEEKGLTLATATTTQKDEVKKETKERCLAVAFILGADRGRYAS